MLDSRTSSLGLATLLIACSGENPTDITTPCLDDTATVSVSVGAGVQPVFSWDPPCAVAFLIVERQGSDMWLIGTDLPGSTDIGEPDQVNLITPPVAYGEAPSAVDELHAAEALHSGVSYELVLWRSPPGSTANCITVALGGCLMAVHEFTP